MMTSKYLAIAFIIALLSNVSYSQPFEATVITKPEVGKPMPDLALQNVHYFKKPVISLGDFRGKWLILNFWYRGCVASIKTLSKVNTLQNIFNDQVQFVLIGVNRAGFFGKGIEELYERLREKIGLKLPCVFDSALSQEWHIRSFPYIIIIDPNGIVKAITNASDMTKDKLTDLLQGRPVQFYDKEVEPPQFNGNEIGRENLSYRSLLSRWSGEKGSVPDVFGHLGRSRVPGYRVSRVPLYRLYILAYIGKAFWHLRTDPLYHALYPYPVIEVKDTTLFAHDYDTGKGLYNYELIIKDGPASKERVMHIMQAELRNVFNCEAFIETRVMPVWQLVATPEARERLRANERSTVKETNINGDGGVGGFTVRNITTHFLLDLVKRYISDDKVPFFDETKINHPIDITIDALMTDRDQIRKELQRNGLDLIIGEKSMKVLVIKDAKGV